MPPMPLLAFLFTGTFLIDYWYAREILSLRVVFGGKHLLVRPEIAGFGGTERRSRGRCGTLEAGRSATR
jgi:hypothetical protein